MNAPVIRCAVYTRKSSEEGLEQSFNSLDAQREACEAYVSSQRHEGWQLLATPYDDGGFSGGNMQRPALVKLLNDIAAKRVDTVVVYKVDRLTRSLADFAKIVEQFDKQGISFVSVTQQFNTTTSMGRLTLNVLLSFAQFEREVTGERIRDKIAASKRKGMWMGGVVPLGYDLRDRNLVINPDEAAKVRTIYHLYLAEGCVSRLRVALDAKDIRSKKRLSNTGNATGDNSFSRGALYQMLQNRVYLGEITHKENSFPGRHEAIVTHELWDRVQAQFKANQQSERTWSRQPRKSMLMGLLFNGEGQAYTPSHTNKKGKRYHYYIAQMALCEKNRARSPHARIPATEIEALVLKEIKGLFSSPQRLREILERSIQPSKSVPFLEALANVSMRPDPLLISLLRRVVVHDDRIEIHIDKQSLLESIQGDGIELDSTETVATLIAETRLNRSGGAVRLQFPTGSTNRESRPIGSLVRAVARAHHWVERVVRGDIPNQRALAAETGCDERYISKIIPLAFLAPDITESILDGSHDESMQLGSCVENVPLNWIEQRQIFASTNDRKTLLNQAIVNELGSLLHNHAHIQTH